MSILYLAQLPWLQNRSISTYCEIEYKLSLYQFIVTLIDLSCLWIALIGFTGGAPDPRLVYGR